MKPHQDYSRKKKGCPFLGESSKTELYTRATLLVGAQILNTTHDKGKPLLYSHLVIDNVSSIRDLREREGVVETLIHTALSGAKCFMGLETTTRVPASHV